MRKEATRWLAQAKNDLDNAEFNQEGGRHYVASLLAQQGAEKALKALYIEQHLALPPRTHNLEQLGEQVGVSADLNEALRVLTPVYFTTRYPDAVVGTIPAARFNQELSRNHLNMAWSVVEWVKQQISSAS